MGEKTSINFIGDIHFTPSTPSSRKDDYFLSLSEKYLSIAEVSPAGYWVYCGDVFHKPSFPTSFVNKCIKLERDARDVDGHVTFAISGNHDCSYSDLDYLGESALGNWFGTGFISLLNRQYIRVDEDKTIELVGWPINTEPPKANKDATYSILVGHAFYESAPIKGKDLVLLRQDVEELGYDLIVLGHDHGMYKPFQIGKTWVVRPGSLSRGTAHDYNLWRNIYILRMEFEARGERLWKKFEYKLIPSKPAEEVFVEKARDKHDKQRLAIISSFIKEIKAAQLGGAEIYEILDDMQLTQEDRILVQNYLISYGIIRNQGGVKNG